MIKLDGAYMEGGGQIVRNALALSAITGKGFEVDNIRKGRCDSGLKPQHLHCVKAVSELCSAEIEDVETGSTRMKFLPKKIRAQNLDIDIGTAGSVTLLLQSVLIPAMFSNATMKLSIKGGTDVNWSMPVDYLHEVFLPHLQKYAAVDYKLVRRGYYPKGSGLLELTIKPKYKLKDFDSFEEFHKYLRQQKKISLTEQGKLQQIKGVSHSSKLLEKARVAERQAQAAKLELSKYNVPIEITSEYCETLSPGSGITLWAIFADNEIDFDNPIRIGADALGEKGKQSEEIGKEAVDNLAREIKSGAPVDSHLEDNLIPFLGLFGGRIKVPEITKHTLTNIYVTEQFLNVKFNVDEENKIISI